MIPRRGQSVGGIMMSFDKSIGFLTIDVEEWFHILDDPAVPASSSWDKLEARLPRNMDRLLAILDEHRVKATMFWLGWAARKYPEVVRRCVDDGHEVASHGCAHVLAYDAGRARFREDICRGKRLLRISSALKSPVSGRQVSARQPPRHGFLTRYVRRGFFMIQASFRQKGDMVV